MPTALLARNWPIRLSHHVTWTSCLLLHSLTLLSTACFATVQSEQSGSVDGKPAAARQQKVAILGSGIAAASAAYFLHDLSAADCRIDVISREASDSVVGGRLSVAQFDGRQFESGGSIIHDKNLYMRHFADSLGLERLYHGEEMRLAVYNGKETVLDTSDWYLVKMAQLLHRYGLSAFVNLRRFITSMLDDFGRIYARQNAGQAFTSVGSLLAAMSDAFPRMASQTIEKLLSDSGFDSEFINELVAGAMRNNYGQNVSIHGFVGSVSLAGAEGGLWSVRGGNRLIVSNLLQRLAKQSQDNNTIRLLFDKRVTRVAKAEGGGWLVISVGSQSDSVTTEQYDQVILTVPGNQQFDIQTDGFEVPRVDYQTTVATFVKGVLNHRSLGLSSRQEQYSILTGTPAAPLDFNSVGYQHDVDGAASDRVYKAFSERSLSSDQLAKLFSNVESTQSVTWPAYPLYRRDTNVLNASFVLADGLYHTSPIELAASAMEMSAIAGRNAALLARNHWTGLSSQLTDPSDSRPPAQDSVRLHRIEL